MPPQKIDTNYDGIFIPRYTQSLHNQRITDPVWNHDPTIFWWQEMFRPEGLTHQNLTRVISLRPVDLNMGESPLTMLIREFKLTL